MTRSSDVHVGNTLVTTVKGVDIYVTAAVVYGGVPLTFVEKAGTMISYVHVPPTPDGLCKGMLKAFAQLDGITRAERIADAVTDIVGPYDDVFRSVTKAQKMSAGDDRWIGWLNGGVGYRSATPVRVNKNTLGLGNVDFSYLEVLFTPEHLADTAMNIYDFDDEVLAAGIKKVLGLN